MKISTLIADDELLKLQEDFYSYFETGYAFEEFLKEYLIKMGLDEVEVTQRSKDGGVDLTAIRRGVGDFSEIDIIHYFIQAKRYNLKNRVGVNTVRQLKGIIPFGYKGMLITTSDFSKEVVKEATNDPSKPVVLINGKSLVQSCIDNSIGFIFKPIFSFEQMDIFLNKDKNTVTYSERQIYDDKESYIEKVITSNDIRARIISMPSSIIKMIPDAVQELTVIINNSDKKYVLRIDKSRRYLGGVTEILRENGLLSKDNIITSKNAKWNFDVSMNLVKLIIEN